MVSEGDGVKRKLVCGTTKEKHKAKNLKTAGKVRYNKCFIPILFPTVLSYPIH
jgi:hypothetical protein